MRRRLEMRPFPFLIPVFLPLSVTFIIGFISDGQVFAAERGDVSIGLYALGAFPSHQGLFAQGIHPSDTRISNGVGAGIKVGVFPRYFQDVIGIELESFGHGSEISLCASPVSTGISIGTNIWVLNSMMNLILRYPGKSFVPYVGIGGGLSDGVLVDADVSGRLDKNFEGSWTLGSQFFGGVQGNLSEEYFLFGEYKYFSANYHWKQLALDFRSQYLLFGIGLRF